MSWNNALYRPPSTTPRPAVSASTSPASPLLALIGWVLFGPRGRIDDRIKVLTIVFPLAWAAFAFARVPLVDGLLRKRSGPDR